MNRFVRRCLVLLVSLLLIAVLCAGYATLYPVVFTWNTPVLNYQADSRIDCQAELFQNDFNDQTGSSENQTYLLDFTRAFNAAFYYHVQTDRSASLQYQYHITATLKVLDAANPTTVLMTKSRILLPECTGQITGPDLQIDEKVRIALDDYDEWIAAFADQTTAKVEYVLSVALIVQAETQMLGGPVQIIGEPTLLIPLNRPQFQLTRLLADRQPVQVWQPVRYQLVLTPIPFPIYPATAGVCFLLLVIILTTTRSRRKNKFNHQLRRMLRQARSRLMIIGDKAWEPEWCITASDFRSMVRTAKKLKHPLFCYIDRQSDQPAAYFYVYFGENNYCYTLTGLTGFASKSAEPPESVELPPESDDKPSMPEPDDSIPVLPDSDESPEILLARLKAQTSYNH